MPEDAVLEAPAELEAPDLGGEELETPEMEAPEAVDDPNAPAVDDDLDTPDEPEEPTEEVKEEVVDGRKMPDGLKKAISALKATSPEAAKQIKGLYYSEQAYREVFPKPEEAIAAKTLIEEVGGAEGIQQIQAERQEWNEIDQAFAEGKKEFVTSLAENSPEGFLKTAPHVINEFAARAPEQYQYYANNVAYNTVLREPGVEAGLQTLSQLHAQLTDAPWAQQAIASVVNGIVGLKEKAAQFEQKRNSVDPEREKLNQEKSQFEQQRRADFEGRVDVEARKGIAEKMQPEIARIVGNRKVDADAMKGYQKMVADAIDEMLEAVPGMKDKLEAHYRTGDQKRSVEYILSQVTRILPNAAKVIDPYVRNIPASGKPAPKPDAKGNGTVRTPSAGEVVLKEMPDNSAFDWNKTTVADVIQGHGILKNGKKASGWV